MSKFAIVLKVVLSVTANNCVSKTCQTENMFGEPYYQCNRYLKEDQKSLGYCQEVDSQTICHCPDFFVSVKRMFSVTCEYRGSNIKLQQEIFQGPTTFRAQPCQCQNGQPTSERICTRWASDFCQSCDPGFTLNSDYGSCLQNVCVCEHGEVATTTCKKTGDENCSRCHGGYFLRQERANSQSCQPNSMILISKMCVYIKTHVGYTSRSWKQTDVYVQLQNKADTIKISFPSLPDSNRKYSQCIENLQVTSTIVSKVEAQALTSDGMQVAPGPNSFFIDIDGQITNFGASDSTEVKDSFWISAHESDPNALGVCATGVRCELRKYD